MLVILPASLRRIEEQLKFFANSTMSNTFNTLLPNMILLGMDLTHEREMVC